ncbi:MAG: HRDC domain-containing protein, partial [Clostridiales bacterium]|nr:HRDC domain-containing protein [Clostridiales bacterium]
ICLEGEFPVVKLTDIGREVLKGERKVVVKAERTAENKVVLSDNKKIACRKPKAAEENRIGNEIQKAEEIEKIPFYEDNYLQNDFKEKLFDELKKLRKKLAGESGVPPYIIFSDKSLLDMCEKLPENEDEFSKISGVGQEKLKKYCKYFTEVINDFVREKTEEDEKEEEQQTDNDVFYSLLKENINDIKISEEPLNINKFLKNVYEQLNINIGLAAVRENIYNIFIEKNAIRTGTYENGTAFKDITPKSDELGIIMIEKFSKSGIRYRNINFTAKGQRFILNELIKKEDDI